MMLSPMAKVLLETLRLEQEKEVQESPQPKGNNGEESMSTQEEVNGWYSCVSLGLPVFFLLQQSGICPTALRKVIGSLPEGLILPRMRSVSAGPAIVPRCHAQSTESQQGRMESRSSERPAQMTATMGFPALATSRTRSSCTPGRLRQALQLDSPLRPLSSPRNISTQSACLAAFTASAKQVVSVLRVPLQPCAQMILEEGSAALRLVRGVMESCALPSGAQQPIWFSGSSASAPITARVPIVLEIGRVLLFWRRTAHWAAWARAASLCLGSRMMTWREGSVQQFSKRLSLNLTRRVLATLVLRSSRETIFLARRSQRLSQKAVETISMSSPLLNARRAASHAFSAKPWFMSSMTALQSETTSPSNFHSLRSTCLSVNSLAVLGSPLRSLKADMQVRHPVAHSSLKGGRYMSRSVFSGIRVVLQSRPPSVAPQPTQCFPHAATAVISFRFLLWNPRTAAAPITDAKTGSSPQPQAIRPHRGSRAMSTIGVKVHLIPMEEHSTAAMREPDSTRVGLKEAPWASGMGKTVRQPWMTSLPMRRGILRRDCSIAIFCIWLMFSSFHTLRKEPTPPSAICLMISGESCQSPQEICCSCPIFSRSVMMASSDLMAASMSSSVVISLINFSAWTRSMRSCFHLSSCWLDTFAPIDILSLYCRITHHPLHRLQKVEQARLLLQSEWICCGKYSKNSCEYNENVENQ